VILPAAAWADWLDPGLHDAGRLRRLLTVLPGDRLAEHPVSTLVNSVGNNVAECIAPIDTPPF
jgi:putative SOS response-associated peptidase YedK